MPYLVWMDTRIGRVRAKFIPTERIVEGSAWGPVFMGEIHSNGGRRQTERVTKGRFFADEMEPWSHLF
jgi:hypothetical protein